MPFIPSSFLPLFSVPPLSFSANLQLPVYFGTNLDRRFAVPDFWPKPEETHRIPFEREEITSELERLKAKRLYLREKRLQAEARGERSEGNGEEGM
jgi:protein PET100